MSVIIIFCWGFHLAKSVCLCDFFFSVTASTSLRLQLLTFIWGTWKVQAGARVCKHCQKVQGETRDLCCHTFVLSEMEDIVLKHWSNAVGNICSQHVDSMSPMSIWWPVFFTVTNRNGLHYFTRPNLPSSFPRGCSVIQCVSIPVCLWQ